MAQKRGNAEAKSSKASDKDRQLIERVASTFRGANRPRPSSGAPKKSVLGRGLSSLMSASSVKVDLASAHEAEEASEGSVTALKNSEAKSDSKIVELSRSSAPLASTPLPQGDGENEIEYLLVSEVFANPTQPRKHFDQIEIDALAQSIRETGLLQPIVVRKRSAAPGYEIIAGERRFRAIQVAGIKRVPALVRNVSDKESFQLAIIENVQRADLNPIEEALAYQRLIDEFGESQADVAKAVGKDRVSVANALRLLKLAPRVQELLVTKKLSAGHGRALLMLEAPEQQTMFAEQAVRESLSVRALEQLVGMGQSGEGAKAPRRSNKAAPAKAPNVLELEERFRRALGTKVSMTLAPSGQGEVRISFFSQGELEELLARLGA